MCCLICRTEIEELNVHKAQILQQIDQYSKTIEELRKRFVAITLNWSNRYAYNWFANFEKV